MAQGDDLPGGGAGGAGTIGTGEGAKEVVEAVVLFVDDDDVLDGEGGGWGMEASLAAGRWMVTGQGRPAYRGKENATKEQRYGAAPHDSGGGRHAERHHTGE